MKINELSLLRGEPIFIKNIGMIYPLTLGDIQNLGEENFIILVNLLSFESQTADENNWFCSDTTKELSSIMCWALSVVLKSTVKFKNSRYQISQGGEITKDNFRELAYVIKRQYCLKTMSTENYANTKAKEIAERIKKAKSHIKTKADHLSLNDIISSLAAKHPNLNLFNIWDLTIYQLYDQFKRIQLIDDYDFSIQANLHGADIKKIKHWSYTTKEDD